MRTNHDDVVATTPGKFRQDIVLGLQHRWIHIDMGRGARRRQRCAVGEAGADDGNPYVGWRTIRKGRCGSYNQPFALRCVSLVEYDDCLGSGRFRIDGLLRKTAGTSLNQGNVIGAGEIEPGEISRFAAAGDWVAGDGAVRCQLG